MSRIQLPYGYVNNQKQIRFDLPNNFEESFYLNKVPYLTQQNPAVESKLIKLIKNRDDLKKWLLAISDYGAEIEQNLAAVVGHDEKFNNSIVRHALDLKDESIFHNPNALHVTFHDMKKFDQVNPIIGKLAAQVRASKLTKKEFNQKILDKFEVDTIQARLDRLKQGRRRDDDDDNDDDSTAGGSPGVEDIDEREELERRLNKLRGNISPDDFEYEQFYNKNLRQRKKELKTLEKGVEGNVRRTSSILEPNLNIRLPETPPPTPYDDYWSNVADRWNSGISGPPITTDYDEDFPPLTRAIQKRNLPPTASATSFDRSLPLPPIGSSTINEASLSALRNKLPSIDPFLSLPNINNFSRPITDVVDETNKTIEITPKKNILPPIGQKQLSEELHQIFPDIDDKIKEKDSSFKEGTENIEELIEKISKNEESELTLEFEFFNGGKNLKFESFCNRYGLTAENAEFFRFLQSEYCKKILQNNHLKIHIETGNVYYNDQDTNESIFQFIQNQQNTFKGIIKKDLKFSNNLKKYYKWIFNEFDAQTKILKLSEKPNKIKSTEKFLMTTIENVTVAKKIYKTLFDTISKHFNRLVQDLGHDKITIISEDFLLKNYSYSESITNLNDWISYYYSFGKFPGSEKFINVPYQKKPYFLKTDEHLSPANLHKKFLLRTLWV